MSQYGASTKFEEMRARRAQRLQGSQAPIDLSEEEYLKRFSYDEVKRCQRIIRKYIGRARIKEWTKRLRRDALWKSVQSRYPIVRTFLDEERTRLQNLSTLIDLIFQPMRSLVGTSQEILREDLLSIIFTELTSLRQLHSQFLIELEKCWDRWPETQDVSVPLQLLLPRESFLLSLASKMPDQTLSLCQEMRKNQRFADFIEGADRDVRLRGRPVLARFVTCLLAPLKYSDFAEQLVATMAREHPDFDAMCTFLSTTHKLNSACKESFAHCDGIVKTLRVDLRLAGTPSILSRSRVLLREGPLLKLGAHRLVPRVVFLFNDLLLYARVVSSKDKIPLQGSTVRLQNGPLLVCKAQVPLASAMVERLPDGSDRKRHAFRVVAQQRAYTFCADTGSDRDAWVHTIQSCIDAGFASEIGRSIQDGPARASRSGYSLLADGSPASQAQRRETRAKERKASIAMPSDRSVFKKKERFSWIFSTYLEDRLRGMDDKVLTMAQVLRGKALFLASRFLSGLFSLHTVLALPFLLYTLGLDGIANEVNVLSIIFAFLVQIPKRLIFRARPHAVGRARRLKWAKKRLQRTSSFPSRSAATAVLLVVIAVYAHRYSHPSSSIEVWMILLAIFVPMAATFARLNLGHSFPTDCAAGVGFGAAVSLFAPLLYKQPVLLCKTCAFGGCYADRTDLLEVAWSDTFALFIFGAAGAILTILLAMRPIAFWDQTHYVLGMTLALAAFHVSFLCPGVSAALLPPPAPPGIQHWAWGLSIPLVSFAIAHRTRRKLGHQLFGYMLIFALIAGSLVAWRVFLAGYVLWEQPRFL